MTGRDVERSADARRPCLPDRAGHFEVPLRVLGHAVPAAQAGGGRAVPAAARRPILTRVCRLHLQVVSLAAAQAPVSPRSRSCRWPSRGQRRSRLVPAAFVPAPFCSGFLTLLFFPQFKEEAKRETSIHRVNGQWVFTFLKPHNSDLLVKF